MSYKLELTYSEAKSVRRALTHIRDQAVGTGLVRV